MHRRGSGVLLHVSSLPSGHGVGDAGPAARRFVDLLAATAQRVWQILPLGPTSPALGNSPYSSFSAFAGDPLFISPEDMVTAGLLGEFDIGGFMEHDPGHCQFDAAHAHKETMLRHAFEHVEDRLQDDVDYQRFLRDEASWLEDYVLFVTIKAEQQGRMWSQWPVELRDRHDHALAEVAHRRARELAYHRFVQHLFHTQWKALKRYANERRVRLVGDMPIYVSFDSADVWANAHLFRLDEHKNPSVVAGVPPDYFSATGQLWGNPLYDWPTHENQAFAWWVRRIARTLDLTDAVRLDHFRGFAAYWEVPAGEETAINGQWVEAPGEALFETLVKTLGCASIIAEDLGTIDAAVRELKDTFQFPGMKILSFAFGDNIARSPYIPHNCEENSIIYTGTHDNNTFNGWYFGDAPEGDRARFRAYAGLERDPHDPHRHAIRLAMTSPARTAIFPVQDVLGLGAEARMNTPSLANGNWSWRMTFADLDHGRARERGFDFLEHMTRMTARD